MWYVLRQRFSSSFPCVSPCPPWRPAISIIGLNLASPPPCPAFRCGRHLLKKKLHVAAPASAGRELAYYEKNFLVFFYLHNQAFGARRRRTHLYDFSNHNLHYNNKTAGFARIVVAFARSLLYHFFVFFGLVRMC